MKTLLPLFLLTSFFAANAQCPAPTNFSVTEYIGNAVTLDWTENGTATAWEIGAIGDFEIGDQAPAVPLDVTAAKPYILTGLPPGCTVFYVRSVCFPYEVSDWTMVASPECPEGIFNYVSSLSTNDFTANLSNDLCIYPNPAKNTLSLKSDSQIGKVIISDISGKVIITQTSNSKDLNVETLSKGMYILEVFSA